MSLREPKDARLRKEVRCLVDGWDTRRRCCCCPSEEGVLTTLLWGCKGRVVVDGLLALLDSQQSEAVPCKAVTCRVVDTMEGRGPDGTAVICLMQVW